MVATILYVNWKDRKMPRGGTGLNFEAPQTPRTGVPSSWATDWYQSMAFQEPGRTAGGEHQASGQWCLQSLPTLYYRLSPTSCQISSGTRFSWKHRP